MITRQLLIWGTSGHALVVADVVRVAGQFQVAGFLDDINPDRHGKEFLGALIIGGRECLRSLLENGLNTLIIGFGHCSARLNLSEFLMRTGFSLATAIHPHSTISADTSIGAGTVIMAGVAVNPGTSIGENVIINTCASVDHECVIEEGVHIGPGAHLGGKVIVKRASWIGIGATVKDKVTIGSNSIVGAGAVVLNDVPNDTVVFGVPAKVIRPVAPNEN